MKFFGLSHILSNTIQQDELILKALGYTDKQVETLLNGESLCISINNKKIEVSSIYDAIELFFSKNGAFTDYEKSMLMIELLLPYTLPFQAAVSGKEMQGFVGKKTINDKELDFIFYAKQKEGDLND